MCRGLPLFRNETTVRERKIKKIDGIRVSIKVLQSVKGRKGSHGSPSPFSLSMVRHPSGDPLHNGPSTRVKFLDKS